MHEIIGQLSILDIVLIFFLASILCAHTGITWSGILLQPGNMLDFLPSKIEGIKNPYIQNLLECPKCISGQFTLWTYVALSIHYGVFQWFFSIAFGIAWVCWIIALTTVLYKIYGFK